MGKQSRKTSKTSMEIIEAVGELDSASLTEISDYTDIPTSTLHTHLQTLKQNEYLQKKNSEYRLGMKMFHLGEKARRRDERYQIAKEEAWQLSNRVGEEVSFAVEENGRMIIIYDEITAPSEEGFQVGRYFNMHSSACGKAALAEFSDERIRDIIDKRGLKKHTGNTIASRSRLFHEIQQIREQGYAVNKQEELEGLRAVAVAINKPNGDLFGTLDISGPPYRLPDDEIIADRLQEAVDNIEQSIKNSRI